MKDMAFMETVEISFEISECEMELDEIIKAVEKKYPDFKFSRTEARYETCVMAVFEHR